MLFGIDPVVVLAAGGPIPRDAPRQVWCIRMAAAYIAQADREKQVKAATEQAPR